MINHDNLVRIVIMAVCAALYFVLCTFGSIPIGNVRVTLAPLVIIVIAALYGPLDAVLVAFIGAFINQLFTPYGLTSTTLLWCVPHMLRGLIIGLFAMIMFKRGQYCENSRIGFILVCSGAALIVTVTNTAVYAFDAWLFKYYTPELIFGDFFVRLGVGVATSIVLCVVSNIVIHALRLAHFGKVLPEAKQTQETIPEE